MKIASPTNPGAVSPPNVAAGTESPSAENKVGLVGAGPTPPAGGLSALFAKKKIGNNPQTIASQNTGLVATQNAPPDTSTLEITIDRPAIPIETSNGPTNFQEKLQRLDFLIGERERVDKFDLDHIRGLCKDIMIDLKTMPEFDGMVRAKDVHNLMVYVQSSVGQAKNQFALNADKTVKKTERKNQKSQIADEMFMQFFAPTATKLSLEDLSTMNTDDITAKDRNKK